MKRQKMNNQILENLTIKNFRSYKDISVDFHPGVNVIIGANDSGKSNLLRAIDLVVNNNPGGDDYISDWGGDCDIKLTTGGKTVGRFRNAVLNKKEKKYKAGTENLYTMSGEPEPFRAFGRGKLPDIIKQHLNISSLNIGFQLDGPFLLGKNPPDVARHYNSLVNLEIIDRTISNIASTLRKEKSELKIKETLAKEKKEELKVYDWVENAEKDLSKLEKLNTYLKHLNSEWTELAGQIQQLEKLEKSNQILSVIVKYEKEVDTLGTESIEIKVQKQKQIELSTLITDIEFFSKEDKKLKEIIHYQTDINALIDLENQINKNIDQEEILEKYINQLKQTQKDKKVYINIVKYADTAKDLLVLSGTIEKGIAEHDFLFDLLEKRLKLDKKIIEWKSKQQALEKAFENLAPEICPLCNMIIEKWKSVLNFEGFYEVSNYGKVRSFHRLRNIKDDKSSSHPKAQTTDRDGYNQVSLYKTKKNGEKYNTAGRVHRLVLEAFTGPCPKGMESSHLDGDPSNNRSENLIWETHIDNNNRRKEHGTYYKKGKDHPNYGKEVSKETRQKMSQAQKKSKRIYSKETRQKLKNAANKRWNKEKHLDNKL